MDISLGFILALLCVLLPGVIFRRFYFYSEFSKQFNYRNNILWLLAVSSIPGIPLLILGFTLYNTFVTEIDLEAVVDIFKDIGNTEVRLKSKPELPLKEALFNHIIPFLGLLYLSSALLGMLLGPLVRFTHLDVKWKIFRFKNYWFYVFSGTQLKMRKYKVLAEKDKKHVFTYADLLIDTQQETILYTGIVVDYELEDSPPFQLSKVVLDQAQRYNLIEGKRVPVKIPGNLFIVDCSTLRNINLRYVYKEVDDILKSTWPKKINTAFVLILLFLLPFFLFKASIFEFKVYEILFDWPWYIRVIAYLTTIQFLSLLVPFVEQNGMFRRITKRELARKILWCILYALILRLYLFFRQ